MVGALIEQNLLLLKDLDFTFTKLLLLSSLGECIKRTVLKYFIYIKYLYEYWSFGVIIGYEIKTLCVINLSVNSL